MIRSDAIEAVLTQAHAAVGISEEPRGSNDGPALRRFLAGTGFRPGEAWCAYAVQSIGQRALGAKLSAGAWPLPATGDCDVLLHFARAHNVLRTTPRRGDVFLVLASDKDAVHTGFVTAAQTEDAFATIEGNSNGGGSREGWTVAARPERATDPAGRYVCRFVRWADLLGDVVHAVPGVGAEPYRAAGDVPSEEEWSVYVGAQPTPLSGRMVGDRVVVPVRALLERLHGKPAVDAGLTRTDAGLLVWAGKVLPIQPVYRCGVAFGWVRPLASSQGLIIGMVDTAARSVRLVRPTTENGV